jgi:uncharacterized protein YjiS (DUF1127 family)
MTTIQWHEPHRHIGRRKAWHAVGAATKQVFATLREWRRRTRDRARLAELDERMLHDIGITRTDAEFLINKPFWRE